MRMTGVGMLVACLLAGACSTTGEQAGLTGGGVVADATSTTTADDIGGSTSTSTGPAIGADGSVVPTAAPSTTVTVAGPASPMRLGRGMTATSITLGVDRNSDVRQANTATGGSSFRPGEPQSFTEAFIGYVNRRGGIAGRKVEPSWVDSRVVSGNSPDAQDQAKCTSWTQDDEVFAAQLNFPASRALIECLQKRGTISVPWTSVPFLTEETARRLPLLYAPGAMSLDRLMRAYADTLLRSSFFAQGARVGLVYDDDAEVIRAVDRVLKPALSAAGVRVQEEQRVVPVTNIDTYAAAQPQIRTAILRFQTARIDHVLFPVNVTGGVFAQDGHRQGYRPRYAFNSSSTPRPGGIGEHEAYQRAVLVSSKPGDVGLAASNATPAARRCLAALREMGHPPPVDVTAIHYAFGACDFIFFVKAVLERTDDWTAAGFQAAAESMPRQVGLQTTAYDAQFGPGRHDGAGSVRAVDYVDECGCWRPRGGWISAR